MYATICCGLFVACCNRCIQCTVNRVSLHQSSAFTVYSTDVLYAVVYLHGRCRHRLARQCSLPAYIRIL